jgi:DHA2 family multidrug resistance protein-like MFS transporter
MSRESAAYRGDDTLLFGIIFGVLAFWLFAQTPLNIAPAMAADLEIATNVMNIAVSITALFSGIFIVVVGGLADRMGRVKTLMWDSSSASSARSWSGWHREARWQYRC